MQVKVLVCVGDGQRASKIREIIADIVKGKIDIYYEEEKDFFVASTTTMNRDETRVYLILSDYVSVPEQIEKLADKIARKSSLNRSQVICAVKFP
jgi:hypothetical protein